MTRFTDQKVQCVYIHVCQIIRNQGPGPFNLLRHAESRKYFSSLSLMQNQREAQVLLGEGSGKKMLMFLLKKK